jgi:type I restriction enzyme S subunit
MALVRTDSAKLLPSFFLYYFLSEEFQALLKARTIHGSTVERLPLTDFPSYLVRVPPIPVQAQVVAVLEAIDARIDLLRQTNATLESIAQALFKSWFIDFDPVRAKAEGREPEGMDAATAALFPAEFEESALGLLPAAWQRRAVQDVVEKVYDGPHATPPEATEGPVFLGIKNLTGTSIDLSDVRHIGEDDWGQWTRRVTPQPDDIVFSYEAALGLFALIPPGLRCCLGRRLALVRPKINSGTPHFWFHQFIGAPFQQLLAKHTVQGATVNRIALKEFPSFEVIDPGEALRLAFETVIQPLWARIHANREQGLRLTELRDTLLPRLISGKLRLPEAQAQMEALE